MEILFSLLVFAALIYGLKRYLSGTKKNVDYPVPGEIPEGTVIPDLVSIPDEPIQVKVDAAIASTQVAKDAKPAAKKQKVAKKSATQKAPAKQAKTAKSRKPKMTVVK